MRAGSRLQIVRVLLVACEAFVPSRIVKLLHQHLCVYCINRKP
jgi:hypothetical protein